MDENQGRVNEQIQQGPTKKTIYFIGIFSILLILVAALVVTSYFRGYENLKTVSDQNNLESGSYGIDSNSGLYKNLETALDQKTIESVSYEITSEGELHKISLSGERMPLVTVANDMIEDSVIEDKVYPFIKGKVLEYWVSPDGNYIAYSVLDTLASCCAGPPQIEANRIKIMRNDGSGKMLVDKRPDSGNPYVRFVGWLSNSKQFVFYDTAPDGGAGGSPFYIGNVDNSSVVLFDAIDYGGDVSNMYVVTVAAGEPRFSPTDDLMVYRKGGIDGEEIILSKTDGTEKKVLLNVESMTMSSIEWSKDGETINITIGFDGFGETTLYRFNSDGSKIDSIQ